MSPTSRGWGSTLTNMRNAVPGAWPLLVRAGQAGCQSKLLPKIHFPLTEMPMRMENHPAHSAVPHSVTGTEPAQVSGASIPASPGRTWDPKIAHVPRCEELEMWVHMGLAGRTCCPVAFGFLELSTITCCVRLPSHLSCYMLGPHPYPWVHSLVQ